MTDQIKRLTPIGAIHEGCIECMGGSQKGPRKCEDVLCRFYPWRDGHDPARVRMGRKGVVKHFAAPQRQNHAKTAIIDGTTDRICVGGRWYKIEKEENHEKT